MVITVDKLGFMEEQINHVKSVVLRFWKKNYQEEALTGALIAKNKAPPKLRKGFKIYFLKKKSFIKMFNLALSYFLRGLPPKYRRRWCVSQPSSGWIGVGPHRDEHQENIFMFKEWTLRTA